MVMKNFPDNIKWIIRDLAWPMSVMKNLLQDCQEIMTECPVDPEELFYFETPNNKIIGLVCCQTCKKPLCWKFVLIQPVMNINENVVVIENNYSINDGYMCGTCKI